MLLWCAYGVYRVGWRWWLEIALHQGQKLSLHQNILIFVRRNSAEIFKYLHDHMVAITFLFWWAEAPTKLKFLALKYDFVSKKKFEFAPKISNENSNYLIIYQSNLRVYMCAHTWVILIITYHHISYRLCSSQSIRIKSKLTSNYNSILSRVFVLIFALSDLLIV